MAKFESFSIHTGPLDKAIAAACKEREDDSLKATDITPEEAAKVECRLRHGFRSRTQALKFLIAWLYGPNGQPKTGRGGDPITGTLTAVHEEFDLEEPRQAEAVAMRNLRRIAEPREAYAPVDKDGKVFRKTTTGKAEKLAKPETYIGVLVNGKRTLELVK